LRGAGRHAEQASKHHQSRNFQSHGVIILKKVMIKVVGAAESMISASILLDSVFDTGFIVANRYIAPPG
jgi:hypothetical protein